MDVVAASGIKVLIVATLGFWLLVAVVWFVTPGPEEEG